MAFFALTNMKICHIIYERVFLSFRGDYMDFVFFKDVLFDLINECDSYDIRSIKSFDKENRFVIETEDSRSFEVILHELTTHEAPTNNV